MRHFAITLLVSACAHSPDASSVDRSDGAPGAEQDGPKPALPGSGGAPSIDGGKQPPPPSCATDPNVDDDDDGFSEAEGDCNDCDANANPGAIEVSSTPADEDCDGVIDDLPATCDDGLILDDPDPFAAAFAIDLCRKATPGDKKWGVLSAAYVRADGTPTTASAQVGLQAGFGPSIHTQVGQSLLALSSGHARTTGQTGPCEFGSCAIQAGSAPAGFPQNKPGCPLGTQINDDIGLELKIRTPTNATGLKFKFKFLSSEFPNWVCTFYNDQFVALLDPAPADAMNGNISFDDAGSPVSVNIVHFDECDPKSLPWYCYHGGGPNGPCGAAPNPYCPGGPDVLFGTGFEGQWTPGSTNFYLTAGATKWLESTAPVEGGSEIKIRFAIWDTTDQALDSTVLIDGFEWVANGAAVSTTTKPVPTPR